MGAGHTKCGGGRPPGAGGGGLGQKMGIRRGGGRGGFPDDHPTKEFYPRRMNTILQNTRRGKLDEGTAAAMKKLAKDKMLRAIADTTYAQSDYPKEMEQDTLLKEALHRGRCNRT